MKCFTLDNKSDMKFMKMNDGLENLVNQQAHHRGTSKQMTPYFKSLLKHEKDLIVDILKLERSLNND